MPSTAPAQSTTTPRENPSTLPACCTRSGRTCWRPGLREAIAAELAAPLAEARTDVARLRNAVRSPAPASGAAVVTPRPLGAIVSHGGQRSRLSSPRLKLVSAVGSGDAVPAVLGAGLFQDQ